VLCYQYKVHPTRFPDGLWPATQTLANLNKEPHQFFEESDLLLSGPQDQTYKTTNLKVQSVRPSSLRLPEINKTMGSHRQKRNNKVFFNSLG